MTAVADAAHAAAATSAAPLSRRRRYGVRALLATSALLAVIAIFAVWADRQLFDADNWAETSSALLQEPAVQQQIAGVLVDSLYENVDVAAELEDALPVALEPLAGPVAGGLRNVALQSAERALARPRVQEAWRAANRITAQQFIALAEGEPGAVTAAGDAVILDLRVLVADLVTRLGLSRSLADRLPPGTGRITILQADEVALIQDATALLEGLAFVLPALSLALLALAVYLARGRRRQTVLAAGLALLGAGLLVLVARRLLGAYVVGALASTEAVRPAAEAAWAIGTGLLRDVAQAAVAIGLPLMAAAWLAGPSRPARVLRRLGAPGLRRHPGLSYAVVAALVLAVIAWGPIPATRQLIPVAVLIAVTVMGVEALRRQTAREFP